MMNDSSRIFINRRDALRRLSAVCGGVIATPLVSAVLAGCRVSNDSSWQPTILSAGQNEVLTIIAERIIPKTDTPGATDAAVNRFIDIIVADYFSEEQRNTFFRGLQDMLACCLDVNNKEFRDCDATLQTTLLQDMIKESGSGDKKRASAAGFMKLMRQFTVIGYYTSEIGATQELHQPLMGQYRGCVHFTENNRAWAW